MPRSPLGIQAQRQLSGSVDGACSDDDKWSRDIDLMALSDM